MAITPEQALGILGLPPHAGGKDIKRAYRSLARKLHPDVNTNSDDTERFKLITAAYEVLVDSENYSRDDSDEHHSETVAGVTDVVSLAILRGRATAAINDLDNEAHREQAAGRPVAAAALRTATDVLRQTMEEFNEAVSRKGWEASPRPAFFVAVERLMADALKTEVEHDRNAEEYLTRGALGLVGLTRIRQIVPAGAAAEAKEAAARAVISAIGQALLRYDLIGMPAELANADVTGGLAPARRLMLNALSATESSLRNS